MSEWAPRPFLRYGDVVLTFAEVNHQANQVAESLEALGTNKGDAVAIMLDNRPEHVAAWFGLSKIGAVEVSINTAFKGDILKYILDHSDARVLICQADYLAQVAPELPHLSRLEHIVVVGEPSDIATAGISQSSWNEVERAEGAPNREQPVVPTDVAQIAYTSGTTGKTKGVLVPHNRIVATAREMAALREIGADDTLYTCLPMFHGNAKYHTIMPALVTGACFALGHRFSASGFWNEVRMHSATQFNYLGVMLAILDKQPESDGDRDHNVKMAWGGGAPRELAESFERRFGITLVEGYGLTEVGVPLSNRPDDRRFGSCGRPMDSYEVQLVGEHDDPVAVGEVGEIVVRPRRPYTTMIAYHKMPEETLAIFRNLWLHTGDLACCDDEGFYWFVDRSKDVIRARGENISSQEIEAIVSRHPAVLECAAVAVASALTEDDVLLVVHPSPDSGLSVPDLFAYCEERMPYFWVPRYIQVSEKPLPRTPTNKIEKHKLREAGLVKGTHTRPNDGRRQRIGGRAGGP